MQSYPPSGGEQNKEKEMQRAEMGILIMADIIPGFL